MRATRSGCCRAEAELDFHYGFHGEITPGTEFADRAYTNALLILKDGAIAFGRYYSSAEEATRFLSISIAKSIVSILIGMALRRFHRVVERSARRLRSRSWKAPLMTA